MRPNGVFRPPEIIQLKQVKCFNHKKSILCFFIYQGWWPGGGGGGKGGGGTPNPFLPLELNNLKLYQKKYLFFFFYYQGVGGGGGGA